MEDKTRLGYLKGIDDYKSALRSEIKFRIASYGIMMIEFEDRRTNAREQNFNTARLAKIEAEEILKLLDTVLPHSKA